MYVPELDRIVLKDACGQRPFANTQTNRKAVITTRVLGLVHELCRKRIHVTKRDLFYTDVKLFQVCAQQHTSFASLLPNTDIYRTCDIALTWCALLQCDTSGIQQSVSSGLTSTCHLWNRTSCSRTTSWRTWHACWGARGAVCMVRHLQLAAMEARGGSSWHARGSVAHAWQQERQ